MHYIRSGSPTFIVQIELPVCVSLLTGMCVREELFSVKAEQMSSIWAAGFIFWWAPLLRPEVFKISPILMDPFIPCGDNVPIDFRQKLTVVCGVVLCRTVNQHAGDVCDCISPNSITPSLFGTLVLSLDYQHVLKLLL